MNQFSITMSRTLYDRLLKGEKDAEAKVSYRGLSSKENIIEYVNKTWGYLGEVVDVVVDE